MNRNECPECGGFRTNKVHTEFELDFVQEVRTCDDCPTQYTASYNLFEIEVDFTDDWEDE